MSTSDQRFHHPTMFSLVPKLTFTNFHTWRVQMKGLLMTQGLWPIVSNTLAITDYLSTMTDTPLQSHRLRWSKDCSSACGIILLHISDDLILSFSKIDNPCTLWAKIRQCYLERLPGVGDLMSQFKSVRLVNEGTVEAYIAKLRKLYLDLEMVDDDDDMDSVSLPVQIQVGLPADWGEHRIGIYRLVQEREMEGHDMVNTVTGGALRVQDEERARRGILDGMPLFVGGVYAAEVCGGR